MESKKNRETDYRHYYRVWDETLQRYGLTPYTMPVPREVTRIVPPASADPDRFMLEQCTGLKDMRGEKIFEKDILLLSKEHNNMLVKVVWLSHFCQYRLVSLRGPCVLFLSKVLADSSKVVGNTHKLEFKTVAEAREEGQETQKDRQSEALVPSLDLCKEKPEVIEYRGKKYCRVFDPPLDAVNCVKCCFASDDECGAPEPFTGCANAPLSHWEELKENKEEK